MSRNSYSVTLALCFIVSCRSAGDDVSWTELGKTFDVPPLAEAVVAVEEPPLAEETVVEETERVAVEPVQEVQLPFRREPVIDEMRRLWIRDPELLLETLENARSKHEQPPLAFLLAIAHAETNGRPLLASEAGAVGLAQATPTAFLIEEQDGPLFVTRSYVDGMRAYVMKKPIGDAVAAVSAALGERRLPPASAFGLIIEARRLRDVGVDEVRLLERWYEGSLEEALLADQRRNDAILDEAERVIREGDEKTMRRFRDATRDEYRSLMAFQQRSWKRYYDELCARRDALLVEEYGTSSKELRGIMAYNAGEYLARVFDARFSPSQSAAFLVRHLDRKISEARSLEESSDDLTSLAAALYNGGAHNVLRMRVGLIESLRETERYSEKVPSTRRRIELAMAAGGMQTADSTGGGG